MGFFSNEFLEIRLPPFPGAFIVGPELQKKSIPAMTTTAPTRPMTFVEESKNAKFMLIRARSKLCTSSSLNFFFLFFLVSKLNEWVD